MTDLPGCNGSTVIRDKKVHHNRSYLIFIVSEKQELILLGHEIYAAISVGVWDFQMPKCWGLKFFHKLSQNLPPPPFCSILNNCSLRSNCLEGVLNDLSQFSLFACTFF